MGTYFLQPFKEELSEIVQYETKIYTESLTGNPVIQILQPCRLYTNQCSYIQILDLKTWVWEKIM